MTNEDAIKWLDNLKNDLGNLRYECLWPYAMVIDEICELLEEQEAVVRCKDCALLSDGKCKWWDIIPRSDDWFCADGERR